MRKFMVLLLVILITKVVVGQFAPLYPCRFQLDLPPTTRNCDDQTWKLVFVDNFDGNVLDTTKWNLPSQGIIRDFAFNQEKQWYATFNWTETRPITNNIQISNGQLKLTANRESPALYRKYVVNYDAYPYVFDSNYFDYSSGEIDSKTNFLYGKIEIRCKIPSGKGLFPAFWLHTTGSGVSNELDVFEFWQNNTNNHKMTYRYGDNFCAYSAYYLDYSQSIHVYSVIWDEYKMEWYVDDNLELITTKYFNIYGGGLQCNNISPIIPCYRDKDFPDKPMQVIANLAIQNGQYAPDNSTVFPRYLEIDYIRVYQKTPQSGLVDLCEANSIKGNDIICRSDIISDLSSESLKFSTSSNIPEDPNVSATTFQFSGPNAGNITSWICSPNLEIVSMFGSTVKVKSKNSGYGIGSITAYFTPTEPCTKNYTSRSVWIGHPSQPGNISIDFDAPPGRFTASIDGVPYATYYKWYLDGVLKYTGPSTCVIFQRQLNNYGHIYNVDVYAWNDCGSSILRHAEISESSIDYLTFSPNPGTDNVLVTINNPLSTALDTSSSSTVNSVTSGSEENNAYTVHIYDSYGILYKTLNRTGKSFTIPVRSLKDGTYIVKVCNNVNSYSGTLMIKR